jgi:putative hydrolase of HD superfamily
MKKPVLAKVEESLDKPTLQDLQMLARDVVLPFYAVRRHNPLRMEGGRRENDAEHSWSVALVAAALAPQVDASLNVGKICQYATVHDLVELHAGDTSNFAAEDKKASKNDREQAALQRMKRELQAFPWIVDTMEEYEGQSTPEARFVKSIDKIIPLLFDYIEEGLFYHEQKITLADWQKQMQNHRKKASTHPESFVYYEQIWDVLVANPHFFHAPAEP